MCNSKCTANCPTGLVTKETVIDAINNDIKTNAKPGISQYYYSWEIVKGSEKYTFVVYRSDIPDVVASMGVEVLALTNICVNQKDLAVAAFWEVTGALDEESETSVICNQEA